MKSYYIVNEGDVLVRELKPGVGEFIFPVKERVKIEDFKERIKVPATGKEIEYVRHTAEDLAKSIIQDSGNARLKLKVFEEGS